MTWLLAAACAVASVPAGLRWLRIAQREHYHAPSVSRFAWRWWTTGPNNLLLSVLGLIGVAGVLWDPRLGFLVAAAQLGPVGLSVRGRTSPLAWTSRMRRLAGLVAATVVGVYLIGGVTQAPLLVVAALFALPAIVDLALAVMAPVEEALGSRWVEKAAAKLRSVDPKVVAITGSYGKTSTKTYLAHILEGSMRTVASPASFNNRMGLAKAINEGLVPGTEVFIAEMGTYGPGEIADLTEWIRPNVAAMVAIGPVHLERFGTEERIVSSKAEILDRADVGVICVDHPMLERLAAQRSETMEIVEVSGQEGRIKIAGDDVAAVPPQAFPGNIAVAMGIAISLGVDPGRLAERLTDLPVAEHRQSVLIAEKGFTIIDDTFNSNPAGAKRALEVLDGAGEGRTVVVTPGMVELGGEQETANAEFASLASDIADDLLIVGQTNRSSLLRGSANGSATVTVVASRDEAVDWVRENLGPGDAVLYENDLPDHYP